MNNNCEEQLDIGLANRLLDVSLNSDTASKDFHVDFKSSTAALKCIGRAIRHNTKIEYLSLDLDHDNEIEEGAIKDILHFISNNPSLKFLHVNSGARATRCLESISDQVFSAFHGNPWLKTLSFGNPNGCILESLTSHRSEKSSLKILAVGAWDSCVTTFLLSPFSNIEHLGIDGFRFGILHGLPRIEFYGDALDQLIWGLMGSPTVTRLTCIDCVFSPASIEKFLKHIELKLLPIKDLTLIYSEVDFSADWTGEHIRRLLACNNLDSLRVFCSRDDWTESDIGAIKQGLESSTSLSTFAIEMNMLLSLSPSLEVPIALHSLTSLEISRCSMNKRVISELSSLLKNENCRLRSLSFDSTIVEHLSALTDVILHSNGRLEMLCLASAVNNSDSAKHILECLQNGLGNSKTLKSLQLKNFPMMTNELEGGVISAVSKSWSLENITVTSLTRDDVLRKSLFALDVPSLVKVSLAGKLEFYTERNKMHKKLCAPIADNDGVLNGGDGNGIGIAQGVEVLASWMMLREGLSLVCWLFQEQPELFFNEGLRE